MNWVIGPQLIGLIFIIAGYIQKRFPPRQINALYGYRMPSAMKNQETWDEANRYSAFAMMKIGFMVLLAGLALTFVLNYTGIDNEALSAGFMIFSAMGTAVALIVITEKHLRQKFEGNK